MAANNNNDGHNYGKSARGNVDNTSTSNTAYNAGCVDLLKHDPSAATQFVANNGRNAGEINLVFCVSFGSCDRKNTYLRTVRETGRFQLPRGAEVSVVPIDTMCIGNMLLLPLYPSAIYQTPNFSPLVSTVFHGTNNKQVYSYQLADMHMSLIATILGTFMHTGDKVSVLRMVLLSLRNLETRDWYRQDASINKEKCVQLLTRNMGVNTQGAHEIMEDTNRNTAPGVFHNAYLEAVMENAELGNRSNGMPLHLIITSVLLQENPCTIDGISELLTRQIWEHVLLNVKPIGGLQNLDNLESAVKVLHEGASSLLPQMRYWLFLCDACRVLSNGQLPREAAAKLLTGVRDRLNGVTNITCLLTYLCDSAQIPRTPLNDITVANMILLAQGKSRKDRHSVPLDFFVNYRESDALNSLVSGNMQRVEDFSKSTQRAMKENKGDVFGCTVDDKYKHYHSWCNFHRARTHVLCLVYGVISNGYESAEMNQLKQINGYLKNHSQLPAPYGLVSFGKLIWHAACSVGLTVVGLKILKLLDNPTQPDPNGTTTLPKNLIKPVQAAKLLNPQTGPSYVPQSCEAIVKFTAFDLETAVTAGSIRAIESQTIAMVCTEKFECYMCFCDFAVRAGIKPCPKKCVAMVCKDCHTQIVKFGSCPTCRVALK